MQSPFPSPSPEFLSPELLLSAIVGSSEDAIISKNLSGIITSWNQSAERILGYTAAEAVGRSVSMLIPGDRQSEEPQILAKLQRGERVAHFETIRVRKDGTLVEVSLTISPVRNATGTIVGASKILRDISQQKKLESALREIEALSSSILNSTADCIKVLDPEGTLLSMNSPGQTLFGIDDFEQIQGKPWQKLWSVDMEPVVAHAVASARAGHTARFQGPCKTARGEEKWWDVIVSPLQSPGPKALRLTATSRDITVLRRAEESAHAAKLEAEKQSRIKDEFLATLSHELRTPLQAVLGWIQILVAEDRTDEDLAEGLESIRRNAVAQTLIIEDLLDLNSILSGKTRLDVQSVNLADVLHEAMESIKPAANAKAIKVETVLDPVARPVAGDPSRLQQVFWNLLSNAIKFTPRGGRVQVLLERVNSHLAVTVADSGEGIEADFLPFVFERFRQADASSTRRHGGLGLGLAIVKQLVELHGGTVKAKSGGIGKGASFIVELPVPAVMGTSEEVSRWHPAAHLVRLGSAVPELEGVSVLAVDDEADARILISRILTKAGASVRLAGSASEALVQIRQSLPQVLICDIGMPETDGYGLLKAVRALPASEGGSIPAIALTAYTRVENRIKALSAGFQMHLGKPADALELLTMVASLAGRK
jgi:PAS domain S-box-containing protein